MNNISMFFLSGFNETKNYRSALFFLSLMCYCIIILVNVSLVLIIILDNNLHEPMYVMLCAFCINGLYGATGFFPKFLWDLFSPVHIISFSGCLVQAQVIHSFSCCDVSILAIMAYDRYLAICRPLQYHSVMSRQKVFQLVFFSWVTPSCIIAISMFLTYRLTLCSSSINRLYCANWNIVVLSCFPAETFFIDALFVKIIAVIYAFHGIFIVGSYIYIAKRCAGSLENRAKFMQTCVPHLISLLTFILTLLFDIVSIQYGKELPQTLQNFISIEFLIIPPIMNPLIYGYKLTNVRHRIIRFVTLEKKSFVRN